VAPLDRHKHPTRKLVSSLPVRTGTDRQVSKISTFQFQVSSRERLHYFQTKLKQSCRDSNTLKVICDIRYADTLEIEL
jgi:hypothetical protein